MRLDLKSRIAKFFMLFVFSGCMHSRISSLQRIEIDKNSTLQKKTPKIKQDKLKKSKSKFFFSINKKDPSILEHDLVKKWIHYYTKKGRRQFQKYLDRGSRYKLMIQQILKKHGVPEELYYLAMIESGFHVYARSHAQAVGVWQFIAPTGKRHGLRVNLYVDERIDPVRSTIAAAEYLKDLFNVFHSWPLAMAAYNAGEGRIMNAIMKHGTRDYWEIIGKKALARETRNYVPKVVAAYVIGTHLEKYGFREGSRENTLPDMTSITLPSPIRLSKIAKVGDISLALLKELNPHLKLGITPPFHKNYRVWIPKNDFDIAKISVLQNIKPLKLVGYQGDYYRVKRGDSLYKISRRFGISIKRIKNLNRLLGHRIRIGQRLLVKGFQDQGQFSYYKVKKGDTLGVIARKFRTSVKRIKRINLLKSLRIYPGQVLKI